VKISTSEVNYVLNLAAGEKPEKRVREYLQNLIEELQVKEQEKMAKQKEQIKYIKQKKIQDRAKLLAKMHGAFFAKYFKSFAGRHAEECAMEAYTEALACLRRDSTLEYALKAGWNAGGRLYTSYTKEVLTDREL
jgi:hypothetical protein